MHLTTTQNESVNAYLKVLYLSIVNNEKVQVGKDQEKAQSEKDSHSKNRVGKNKQTNNQALTP